MKIDTICNSLLETLIQVGYNENTISTTGVSSAGLKLFAKKKKPLSIPQNSGNPMRMT